MTVQKEGIYFPYSQHCNFSSERMLQKNSDKYLRVDPHVPISRLIIITRGNKFV